MNTQQNYVGFDSNTDNSEPTQESVRDAALRYHRMGLRPLPAAPRIKRPCIDWMPYKDTAPTESEIMEWFGDEDEDRNICVVLGHGSPVVVVDLDNGMDAIGLLESIGMELPDGTPITRTARGLHLWFRVPAGMALQDRMGLLTGTGCQVDVRAEGIIVVPPSIHPDGPVYEWVESLPDALADIPMIPEVLLKLIVDGAPKQASDESHDSKDNAESDGMDGDDESEDWVSRAVRGVSEKRNQTALKRAGAMAKRGLPVDVIHHLMRQFADTCTPPLDHAAVWKHVEYVIGKESRKQARGPVTIQSLEDAIAQHDAWKKNPNKTIPLPLDCLNEPMLGGLAIGRMCILIGRPGSSKSAFAAQAAIHAAGLGHRVLYVSGEMSTCEIIDRMIAMKCQRVNYSTIIKWDGDFTVSEQADIDRARRQLSTLPIMFVEDGRDIDGIETIIKQEKDAGNPFSFVVVDYLQKMAPPRATGDRRGEVEEVSDRLKGFTLAHDVAVLALSSVNRNGGDNKKITRTSARETGTIEHDGDVLLLLHRDERTEERSFDIAKIRGGREKYGIPVMWDGDHQRFADGYAQASATSSPAPQRKEDNDHVTLM